jgi:CHAD domain-containing protein
LAKPNFSVPPHDAAGSAARSTIAAQLRALIEQVPGAQRGEPEAVHLVRVAARRLRAAVRLFAPYIASLRPKVIDERLKWLGKQAGAVRDLDVLGQILQERSTKLDPQLGKDLEPLFEDVRVRRAKAANDLARSLSSNRYKSLAARLSGPIAITARGDAAFGAVAGNLFAPILKSVLRAGDKMHGDPTPDDLHSLRKRAKAARYSLEMMLAIDKKQFGEMLEALEELQDKAGEHHDAVVAAAWVKEFVGTRPLPAGLAFACGALAESFRRREVKLKRRGIKQWNRFVKNDPERAVKKALEKNQPPEISSQLAGGFSQPARGFSNAAVHHAPRTRRRAHAQGR